ncbi:hypothetical protein TNCV_486341 [Trichonephila clavipes]|nr:hypothetical protein TNCV_486341 [Trichonephila clavipes]
MGAYIEVSVKHISQRRGVQHNHPCLIRDSNAATMTPQTASPTTITDGRPFQCIGACGRHPSWDSRIADRPRQQLGQASGGVLSKSHIRWLGESGGDSGGGQGLPPLFPFTQPHERTCGSTAI